MRSFADTLPTLRDSGASKTAPPAVKETPRFNPVFLKKAVTALSQNAAPDAADEAEAEPNVADIRRELLRRQGLGEQASPEDADGAPVDAAAPTVLPTHRAERTGGAQAPGATRQPGPPRPAAAVVPPFIATSSGRSQISLQDQIAEAVAEAKREAEADKAAAVEFARKVERDVASRAVAEARQTWCREEGEAFAARCNEAFDALHQRLSDAFGRALAPIVEGEIRDAAVRRFAAMLDDLVGGSAASPSLTVRGSGQLLNALKQASGEAGVAFEEIEGATELAVTVDETTLRTTIGAWAETLARTLGGDDVE